MKTKLLVSFLCITMGINAQESKTDAAKATIDAFFDAFHKGDTVALKQTLADKLVLQTAFVNKEGKDVLVLDDKQKLINAIGKRPSDQIWNEKLLDYVVKVDGNMANVWTPYEFYFNGNFSHCGVNSFQLFHDNGAWKIIYLIDTRRKKGCK